MPQTWLLKITEMYPITILEAAAAAAKSLQSCPTLCDPTDGSPPGSPVPGILLQGSQVPMRWLGGDRHCSRVMVG